MEINLTQSILDLRTLVAKSILSQLRAFLGALLAKILWVGAQKHFKGLGWGYSAFGCWKTEFRKNVRSDQ